MTARAYWTCSRVTAGVKCGAQNPRRARKCSTCGKTRPAKRKPAHMAALEQPYSAFLEANGGIERCGICGVEPGQRKLHRDHAHVDDGYPRGLLCFPCNLQLKHTSTEEWLRAAADYLERAEAHRLVLVARDVARVSAAARTPAPGKKAA